uniref:Uncharacterized protein n=1 Tax=Mycena chlorophos TaxID=658473 RepID=A0ABQ0KU18_MYCCL|nr:predicted protein [Mycena chlorophos]
MFSPRGGWASPTSTGGDDVFRATPDNAHNRGNLFTPSPLGGVTSTPNNSPTSIEEISELSDNEYEFIPSASASTSASTSTSSRKSRKKAADSSEGINPVKPQRTSARRRKQMLARMSGGGSV